MPEYAADPQVVPYLLYEDAGAAMDWLIRVFGFTERVRDRQGGGTVRHGELLTGNGGVIMLGSPGPGYRGPAGMADFCQDRVASSQREWIRRHRGPCDEVRRLLDWANDRAVAAARP
jgi:hypothetical protein